MPVRRFPLVTNEIYHVFNRGVAKAPIFSSKRTYQRFLLCLNYYRFQQPPVRLSHFLSLSKQVQGNFLSELNQKNSTLVEIYCYCLMTNHFHILLKQTADDGISTFMRKTSNSYSSYFNILTDRRGSLFQGVFRTVRIETEEQLIHVSRYIHLNPYTGHITTKENLFTFPWSSLPVYLNPETASFINPKPIMEFFSKIKDYQQFLLDEADYQKSQQELAYLYLD